MNVIGTLRTSFWLFNLSLRLHNQRYNQATELLCCMQECTSNSSSTSQPTDHLLITISPSSFAVHFAMESKDQSQSAAPEPNQSNQNNSQIDERKERPNNVAARHHNRRFIQQRHFVRRHEVHRELDRALLLHAICCDNHCQNCGSEPCCVDPNCSFLVAHGSEHTERSPQGQVLQPPPPRLGAGTHDSIGFVEQGNEMIERHVHIVEVIIWGKMVKRRRTSMKRRRSSSSCRPRSPQTPTSSNSGIIVTIPYILTLSSFTSFTKQTRILLVIISLFSFTSFTNRRGFFW